MAETSSWTRVRMVSISFAASRVNDWIVLEQLRASPWEMLRWKVSSEFSSLWDSCQCNNCPSQVSDLWLWFEMLEVTLTSLSLLLQRSYRYIRKAFHFSLARRCQGILHPLNERPTKDSVALCHDSACVRLLSEYNTTLAPKIYNQPAVLADQHLRTELKTT